MIKKICIITLSFIMIIMLLSGCNENKNIDQTTKISENEYIKILPSLFEDDEEPIVIVNYMDLEIINGETARNGFTFNVISKEEINSSDIVVNTDTNLEYDIIEQDKTYINEKMPKTIYLQYNNVDWEHIKKIESSVDQKEFAEFEKITDEEYEKIEEIPTFYDNKFLFQFKAGQKVDDEININQIDFILKGKTYTVDIGKINIVQAKEQTQEEIKKIVGDYELSFSSMGTVGARINYNKDGIIITPSEELIAKEDTVIKDIYLTNKSKTLSIEAVMFNIIDGEQAYNQEWVKGSDYEVKAGTNVAIDFVFKDDKYKENKEYSVNIYVTVLYEVNGKLQETTTQFITETKYPSEELYAMYKDNIDITSYYENYLN